mmetsp:Transcript_38102/g.46034  ORF Transcript_38102/g.46034 Transcript_38102/m.46034 type:complete len:91 (+) Transcript_38102:167-439(+)
MEHVDRIIQNHATNRFQWLNLMGGKVIPVWENDKNGLVSHTSFFHQAPASHTHMLFRTSPFAAKPIIVSKILRDFLGVSCKNVTQELLVR